MHDHSNDFLELTTWKKKEGRPSFFFFIPSNVFYSLLLNHPMSLSKYEFHNKLLVRTPVQSLNERNRHWTTIIQDPGFLEAVRISSYDLYQKIKSVINNKTLLKDTELQQVKKSVIKYWSRMCTRPTPFGLFAAVGVASWSEESNDQIRLSEAKIKRKTRLDMSYLHQLGMQIEEDPEINCHLKFYPNSSIYLMGDDYRFLESESHENRVGYKITAVSQSSHLNMVLEQAEEGVTLIDLLDQLCTTYQINEKDAYLYLSELVDAQILVSELEPTVTGAEYFEQIHSVLKRLKKIPSAKMYDAIFTEVCTELKAIDEQVWNHPEAYERVVRKLEETGVKPDPNRLIQVDSFADFQNAKVNKDIKENLLAGIETLMRCQIPHENEDLKRFIDRFNERYEGRQVPLSEVLDPETGIGYPESLDSDLYELGEGLEFSAESHTNTSWNEFESWAFQQLVAAEVNGQYEVEITNQDLEKFPAYQHDLAPSISVLFRVVDQEEGQVMIESVGGSSAINLLGRFAHGSEDIHSIMQDIAEKEEIHNPEVVFAEIAHLPESRAGNILQRPAVRPYEIPYLAKAGVDDEYQVHLQDLYIKMEGGNIQLWSKKLGKRVIPRLSSAHNYTLSNLPVYKFLCDLQTHEKNSSLKFQWGSTKEQFTFFPRIKFQKAILCPAQWRIKSHDIQTLRTAKAGVDRRFELARFRHQWNLPRNVLLADGDNELLIDLSSLDSLEILLDMTKNRKDFIIKEALGLDSSHITNANNEIHSNQMLACLVKEEQSYLTVSPGRFQPLKSREPVRRKFVPGSDWLYYKLYCGNRTSDVLLENAVAPVVERLKATNMIQKWFFIRFDDGNPHVRFRVRLTDTAMFGAVVTEIAKALQPLEEQSLIWRTEIASYEREVNRYGLATIEHAEEIFSIDSDATLKLLAQDHQSQDEEFRWKYLIKAMDDTMNAFGIEMEDRLQLLEKNRNCFLTEFAVDKKGRRELDLKYRKHQGDIYKLLEGVREETTLDIFNISNERLNCLKPVLKDILKINEGEGKPEINSLVSSYIHMTVNRAIVSRQRFYEMILYYFLAKYYKSRLARMNKMKAAA